jgi:hypothetical protein
MKSLVYSGLELLQLRKRKGKHHWNGRMIGAHVVERRGVSECDTNCDGRFEVREMTSTN